METRTAGAAGGPGKPTGSNPGRAPRSDPTLHDHAAYPAKALARAYHWRWIGSETALKEAKSATSGAGPSTGAIFRSQSPALVRQEHAVPGDPHAVADQENTLVAHDRAAPDARTRTELRRVAQVPARTKHRWP